MDKMVEYDSRADRESSRSCKNNDKNESLWSRDEMLSHGFFTVLTVQQFVNLDVRFTDARLHIIGVQKPNSAQIATRAMSEK